MNRKGWIIRVTRTENRKLLWQARFTRFRYFTFLSSVSSFYKYRLQDSTYSSILFQDASLKEKEDPGTLQFTVYSRSCCTILCCLDADCISRHNLCQKIFYCRRKDQRIFPISDSRYTTFIPSYAKEAIRYSWEKRTKLEKGYEEEQLKVTNNSKQEDTRCWFQFRNEEFSNVRLKSIYRNYYTQRPINIVSTGKEISEERKRKIGT